DYRDDGSVLRITLGSGDTTTFYASGNKESFFNNTDKSTTHYLDENFDGQNTGRVDLVTQSDNSKVTFDYWNATATVKTKKEFDAQGTLFKTTDYRDDGSVLRITLGSGDTTTFYASGNKESFLSAADSSLTEYLDETQSRISRLTRADHSKIEFTYWNDTPQAKTKDEFSTEGVLTTHTEFFETGVVSLIKDATGTTVFYPSGNKQSFLSAADNSLTEYLDETQSRISRLTRADHSKIEFTYWTTTGNLQTKTEFDPAGNFIQSTDYFQDGLKVQKVTLANGDITTFYLSGNKESFKNHTDGTTAFYYDEKFSGPDPDGHWTGRVYKQVFKNGGCAIYVYRPNNGAVFGTLLQKDSYSATGALIGTAIYDFDGKTPVFESRYSEDGKRLLMQFVITGDRATRTSWEYDPVTLKQRAYGTILYKVVGGPAVEKKLIKKREETITYLYNGRGARFTESSSKTTYFDTDIPGQEKKKSELIYRYELNPRGTDTRQVYYSSTAWNERGKILNKIETTRTYYSGGQLKSQETIFIHGSIGIHIRLVFDRFGRVVSSDLNFFRPDHAPTEDAAPERPVISEELASYFDAQEKKVLESSSRLNGHADMVEPALKTKETNH
ncbi:MAG: hypothetical protein HYZ52_05195, partial [Candidatus Omnitrophica bacterium]|nr:hypothetical protein [Candidatus Omnitrophota bacterium]